eukprot:TRINITY_DN8855_c0_g1_i19.p1 TRINITY_DN8855_c0_g1~~TRINITY_DN8855_c0_g1_i19.p1  ORF type:complete len:185 (-),score=26.24 TRINITY_DN8855_c0_g1_i19:124-678(-)
MKLYGVPCNGRMAAKSGVNLSNAKATTAVNFFGQGKLSLNLKSKLAMKKKETSPGLTLESYFLIMEQRSANTQNGKRSVSTAEPRSRKHFDNVQTKCADAKWTQGARKELGPLKHVRGGREREAECGCQQRPESRYNKESIYLSLDNQWAPPRNWTRERNRVRQPLKGNVFRKTAGGHLVGGKN